MKTKRCLYCKKRFDSEEEKCPFCGTERVVYKNGDSKLRWYESRQYAVRNAPFMRFLARCIDVLLHLLLVVLAFGPLVAPLMGGTTALQILILVAVFLSHLTEPVLMTTLGYTFGKRVLNIAVRNKSGEKLTFVENIKRSFGVLFWGFGLTAPLISIFTLYFSYVRVSHNEPTRWDEDKDIVVLQKKFDILVVLLAIVLIVLMCDIFFKLSRGMFSFHDSMIRN